MGFTIFLQLPSIGREELKSGMVRVLISWNSLLNYCDLDDNFQNHLPSEVVGTRVEVFLGYSITVSGRSAWRKTREVVKSRRRGGFRDRRVGDKGRYDGNRKTSYRTKPDYYVVKGVEDVYRVWYRTTGVDREPNWPEVSQNRDG